jgi:hypothetical protein
LNIDIYFICSDTSFIGFAQAIIENPSPSNCSVLATPPRERANALKKITFLAKPYEMFASTFLAAGKSNRIFQAAGDSLVTEYACPLPSKACHNRAIR